MSGAPRTNEIRISATLLSRVDSAERTDSLHATARTTWTHSAAPEGVARLPARISGTLTAYSLRFGGDAAPAPPPGLALPEIYAAEQPSPAEQPHLTLPRAEDCGAASSAMAILRELWVSPPATIAPGREWSDSAHYLTCRDSIPLTVTTVRRFRAIGAARRAQGVVVLLERRSVTQMSGSGTQFGEPIDVVAEGSGTMLLELALDGGAIVAGEGEGELRMEMRGRRRSQQLVQRARITIVTP